MSKFTLLFLAVFLGGLYAIFSIGTVFGFFLYELVYFLNPPIRWWSQGLPGLPYSFMVVLATLGCFFLRQKQYQLNTLENFPEAKWFALIFLSYCFVTIFAAAPRFHNMFLFDLFKLYIIMYVAYRLLDSDKKIDMAVLCFCIGAAYIGYEAMSQGRNVFGRVEGIGPVDAPEANGTAAAIAPAVPLMVYYVWQAKWKHRIWMGLVGALVVNGVVLINSRGAFLGVVIGFAYFMFFVMFSKYKLPKQRTMAILILVGSAAVGLRLTDAAFWERMATIEESSSKDSEVSGGKRINFWIATFDLLEDHPFGVGVFGYQVLSPNYLTDESYFTSRGGVKMRAVHSTWFQGLSEIGWHGFFFFLMMLFSLFFHLRRAKKALLKLGRYKDYYRILALESALGTYFVCGTFIDGFRAVVMYFLLLFCICAANAALRRLENNDDKDDTRSLKDLPARYSAKKAAEIRGLSKDQKLGNGLGENG